MDAVEAGMTGAAAVSVAEEAEASAVLAEAVQVEAERAEIFESILVRKDMHKSNASQKGRRVRRDDTVQPVINYGSYRTAAKSYRRKSENYEIVMDCARHRGPAHHCAAACRGQLYQHEEHSGAEE